jgi:hypothetical protein
MTAPLTPRSRWHRFLCRFGWHGPLVYAGDYVGWNCRMRCTRCGMVGLVDSQGNLF